MKVTIEIEDSMYNLLSVVLSEGDTVEDFLIRLLRMMTYGFAADPVNAAHIGEIISQIPGVGRYMNMLEPKEDEKGEN